MKVSQQIKAARVAARLTQQELADLMGTKRENISRLESDKHRPRLDTLINVTKVLQFELKINASSY